MQYILRLLNVRKNEVPRLMLAASVFFLAQIDDGIVKSVSSAVFNVRAGVDKLPLMYTWIAIVFSISMALLSWMTSHVARQRLLFGLMAAVSLVLSSNAVILFYDSQNSTPLGIPYYSYLFVSSELARTLMNFQIWIVAGGICYSSRAKVLFPLLASSAVLGDIAGGGIVRLLGNVLAPHILYGLAVVNMVVVLFLLRQLLRKYFVQQSDGDQEGERGATLGENFLYFVKSAYLLLLFALSIAVFAMYTAIHYSFNVVARNAYATEGEITQFFGLFFALTGVATLAVTTLLLQRLLRWLGTGAIYFWTSVVYGVIAAVLFVISDGIIPLSLIAAIFVGNLLNYVLLDSVVAPAYQVLIKLVPARNSDGTRMIMEGGFMLLGGLVGAGITELHALGLLTMNQFFLLLLLVAITMALCGFLLKRSYTAVLVRAVREQNLDVEDEQAMQALRDVVMNSPDFSRSLLLNREDGVRQLGIEMLRENPGPAGMQVCLELSEHANPRIRSAALGALRPMDEETGKVFEMLLRCLGDEEEEVRLSAAICVNELLTNGQEIGSAKVAIEEKAIHFLHTETERASMKGECLMILEHLNHTSSVEQRDQMLRGLLASENSEELIAGIEASGSVGGEEFGALLFPMLENVHPAVREASVRSLSRLEKENNLIGLRNMLADSDPDVVTATTTGLSNIATSTAREELIKDIDTVSLREWEGLLSVIIRMDDESLNENLITSCRIRLETASRSIVVANVLRGRGQFSELLLDQLNHDNGIVLSGVVRVLGYLGDSDVVNDLLERLSSDDSEGREQAIELLENIADRDLLTFVLPLLESDVEQQLMLAQSVCNWDDPTVDSSLDYVLQNAGVWTQVAAISVANELLDLNWLLLRSDILTEQACHILEELSIKSKGVEMEGEEQPLTTMEKIAFLRGSDFFATLPLEELYHVALSVQEESVRSGDSVIREGSIGDKMYIVVNGELEVRKEGGPKLAILGEKQVFGDMALLDDEPRSASVLAQTDVHLLSLQRTSLERILRRYSSIAFSMMRILTQRLRDAQ
tara:strand:- start:10170 stop:13301 length:3132 start_codon:yes stop_codon:yes gene_type:complete